MSKFDWGGLTLPVGRPPKPIEQHRLDGTFRSDRHGDAETNAPKLTILTKLPRAPWWLGEYGRREWRRMGPELIEKRVLTRADLASFAGYCASLERAIMSEQLLRDQGYTLETPQGFEQARPEVAIARQSWAEVRKFGQEFGITPSSRTRVRAVPDPAAQKKTDDPWAELLGGTK